MRLIRRETRRGCWSRGFEERPKPKIRRSGFLSLLFIPKSMAIYKPSLIMTRLKTVNAMAPSRALISMSLPRTSRPLLSPACHKYGALPLVISRFSSTGKASSKASQSPPKQRVLEKPDRYRPPSHPARLPRRRQSYAGPPLTDEEIQRQKTKRYPHMMPAEGTFMHWFLTDRKIHLYITVVRAIRHVRQRLHLTIVGYTLLALAFRGY